MSIQELMCVKSLAQILVHGTYLINVSHLGRHDALSHLARVNKFLCFVQILSLPPTSCGMNGFIYLVKRRKISPNWILVTQAFTSTKPPNTHGCSADRGLK